MRRLHSPAAWLCIAAHLTLSVGISSLVLCVGEEGHVAIESRFGEDCCDETGNDPAPVRVETPECECTDSALLLPGLRTARDFTPALDHAVASHVLPVGGAPSLARATTARYAERGSPPLTAHRTVVLLV